MNKDEFRHYIENIDIDIKVFGEEEAYRRIDLILKNGYYHTNVTSAFFTKFSKSKEFGTAQLIHNSLIKNGIREWSDHEEFLRLEGIKRSIPPITIVTLPKSGSVFIQQAICQILNIPHIQISLARFPNDYILSESLKIFSDGGALSQTHLDANKTALLELSSKKISRIHVHIRDPRQATASWANYMSAEITREKSHRRHLVDPGMPSGFDDLPEPERMEWFAMNHFPYCIRWIMQWIHVFESDSRFKITFSDHSQLKNDRSNLIKSIIRTFGGDPSTINEKLILEPKIGQFHYRKGSNDEWRIAMPAHVQSWMNEMIPSVMKKMFGWPDK